MNKLIKSLMLVAGVAVVSTSYAQVSESEMAGLCAGNAMKIKEIAQQGDIPKIAKMALEQQNRIYLRYGKEPGFGKAAVYNYNDKSLDGAARLRIAAGCEAKGF